MSKNKYRDKGFTFERAVVNELKAVDVMAERMWGSNGTARGLPEKADLLIYPTKDRRILAQCKNYKTANIAKGFRTFFDNILVDVDVGIAKKENASINEAYVVMKFKTFKELI